MTIDDDMSGLIGFPCEAFFYGCYTVLFAVAVYINPSGPDRWSRVKRPLFILSVLIYMFCSIHFALQFSHFYTALNTGGVEGFSTVTNTVLAIGLDMTLADFTGELIFIYRCWMLWSKNYWIIIFPILASLSGIVSLAYVDHFLIHANKLAPIPPASIIRWNFVVFIVKVCSNLMVTVLIVVRVWKLSPHNRRDILGANLPTGIGWAAIVIAIESGVLYLVAQIVPLILYIIRHPAVALVSYMSVQVYGIASILVFIRMAYLLHAPDEWILSEAKSEVPSTSRPVTNNLGRNRSTTTTPKGSALLIADEMHISNIKWKPSSGDLGSNSESVENAATV
ncbi:hypothetical protein DFH94DRAFT_857376 [Russula ochroleuca]|uniref:Uncharacterized protein n=1 Tax=Russula ochroleuca TaxID=152965 RepID=A0A9P5JVJ4_9AGAM|nr:hypothetical protein DFH94DRAFT_659007 [Russula ochroleuca]KAF8466788.1 hypothetical protein DFH94DRAFT_857376 [Russula ochroleuca]